MKTINTVFLILLVSLAASTLFAQSDLSIGSLMTGNEISTFVKKVEGAGPLTATVQAADGGYVTTSRIDNTSFLVRKIKLSGQKQWERRLNFVDPIDNFASINGIAQTTDGGFVLVGQSGFDFLDFEDVSAATLVKLRPNGTVAWKKIFDVSGQTFSRFSSVIATPDGGFIAIGAIAEARVTQPAYESFVVSFDATGDVVWGKSFKRIAALSYIAFMIPLITSTATPDNGFIVAFPTSTNVISQNPNRVDVLKITNSGIVVWEKSLRTGHSFVFQSVGATADGGVLLIGAHKNSNKLKVVVLKADGTLNWKAAYSLKVPGRINSVSSPIQTPDAGYAVTGTTRSGKGFIAKIDSSRKVAFQNTFVGGGPASSYGRVAGSVFASADRGFFSFGSSVGSTSSDLLVSKVNSEGIVPGCDFFQSLGVTTRTSFGRLRIRSVKISESNVLSLEPIHFGLSSVVTNHPVSTVCH